MDDYAALYGIGRRYASRHLRRRGIPATKEGKELYVSALDLATYKAKRRAEADGQVVVPPMDYAEEMKARRGFSQMADNRQLNERK